MKGLRNPLADLAFAVIVTAAAAWPLFTVTRTWNRGELYVLLVANAAVVIACCTAIGRATRYLRSRHSRRRPR